MWITLLAWTLPTAQAATCDRAGVAAVLDALTQVSEDQRSVLAAAGLAEACSGPAGWVAGAGDLARVSPDMRPMIDAQVALETPHEWIAVCSGGLQPLIDMAAVAASEKRTMLWEGCDLGRHGWMTEAQWTAADGAIVVALVGGHVLGQTGVAADDIGTLVRALAGVHEGEGAGATATELDGFQGLSGVGSPAGDRSAGFAPGGRVEPVWSKAASRAGGACTVQVFVTRTGTLKDLKVQECDQALEGDVRAAVQASVFQARVKDGAAAAGRFRETYEVR